MIVSKKNQEGVWEDLEGYSSRLSGPYYRYGGFYRVTCYRVNSYWHRLYGRSYNTDWDLNNKSLEEFKEV